MRTIVDNGIVQELDIQPVFLLNGVSATTVNGTGTTIDPRMWQFGAVPLTISGISGDVVKLEGNIYASHATSSYWEVCDGGVFTSDVATGLFVPYPFLRGSIPTASAGTITMILGN